MASEQYLRKQEMKKPVLVPFPKHLVCTRDFTQQAPNERFKEFGDRASSTRVGEKQHEFRVVNREN
jgi:hypothetical protein